MTCGTHDPQDLKKLCNYGAQVLALRGVAMQSCGSSAFGNPRMKPSIPSKALLATLAMSVAAGAAEPASDEAAFRDLYKQLVETNTTLSVGSCTQAAEAMQARPAFRKATRRS